MSESGSVRLRLREGFERVRGQTGEAEKVRPVSGSASASVTVTLRE